MQLAMIDSLAIRKTRISRENLQCYSIRIAWPAIKLDAASGGT